LIEHLIEKNLRDKKEVVSLVSALPLSHKIIFLKDEIVSIAQREYSRDKRRFSYDFDDIVERYERVQSYVGTVIIPEIHDVEIIDVLCTDEKKFKEQLSGDYQILYKTAQK
jgi:hypothetical protein